MQFATGLLAFALAAAGVSAAPSINERQAGVVYVRFYPQANCEGDWLEDTVYFDDGTGVCKVETLGLTYASWRIERNEAERPLNVYTGSSCNTNPISIAVGATPCNSPRIGSVQFA
jgi:hypothetical protein